MGGKGTYSTEKSPKYQYETIGKIGNVKILQPIDKTKSLKLPEESHTSGNAYVLLDKDGIFHQYREYNNNHEVVLEIGYHHEKSIGNGDILHAHIHQKPGIDDHATAKKSLSIREIRYMKNTSIFLWGEINARQFLDRIYERPAYHGRSGKRISFSRKNLVSRIRIS